MKLFCPGQVVNMLFQNRLAARMGTSKIKDGTTEWFPNVYQEQVLAAGPVIVISAEPDGNNGGQTMMVIHTGGIGWTLNDGDHFEP